MQNPCGPMEVSTKPVLTWIILLVFFLVMNGILFRSFLFKRK